MIMLSYRSPRDGLEVGYDEGRGTFIQLFDTMAIDMLLPWEDSGLNMRI